MRYQEIVPGRFLSRPNRFIAYVETEEGVQTVHVKNTGRCRELLVSGCTVYLERAQNPARKTAYDLIAVEKGRVIAAARSGKIKTMLTMVGLCLMLLPVPPVVDLVCMIAIVVSTLWSGCEYFARNRDMLAR